MFDVGTRFGELTVEGPGPDRHGEPTALLVCDCGRRALRTTAYLRTVAKAGKTPMCRECLAEMLRGMAANRRMVRKIGWLWAWCITQSLYSPEWDEVVAAELLESFVTDGEMPPLAHGPNDAPAPAAWSAPAARYRHMLILIHHDNGWGCEVCKRAFTDGIGCLGCTGVYCSTECASHTEHTCNDSDGHTYQEIADVLGVTRERVRQIEGRALAKLRHPTRTMDIYRFLFGVNELSRGTQPFCRCGKLERVGDLTYCRACGRTWRGVTEAA